MNQLDGITPPNILGPGKCPICDQPEHGKPKNTTITPTAPGKSGWRRKTMSGIFHSDGKRNTVYATNSFPPSYAYQGHHCIALSAFAHNANSSPVDKYLVLNFYLDQIGFFPNRPQNCIGLPARRSYGDFKAFFASLDLDKPLQLHGPGHDESYFGQCDKMIAQIVSYLTNPNICKKNPEDEWKDKLRKLIAQAENFGFKCLANNDSRWRLHPFEQVTGLRLYFLATTKTMSVTGVGSVSETRNGLGRPPKDIVFPDLDLDVGPFS